MTPDQFVRRRQQEWERLDQLLDRTRHGSVSGLSERELRAVGELYRAAAADLALAQRDFPHHEVTTFLNHLVGRAHHLVYRGSGLEQRRIRHFLRAGFPQLFRQHWRYVGVAALLFFLPALLCWPLVERNPELAYTLMPEATAMFRNVERDGTLWIDISAAESSSAGALIMTNNIQVAFLAFAGGVLAGTATIYVLLMNGIMLGTIFGFVQAYGLADELGSFVIGHGPIELSVICIAGGAGLRLGHAIIAPGLMRRRDAIAQAGRDAMGLVAGSALLLVVAGVIEGFISPSTLPWQAKALTGVASGMLLYAYLLLGGQEQGPDFGVPVSD